MVNGQESAFPVAYDPTKPYAVSDGLSKREWFAGMALQGMLARVRLSKPEDLALFVLLYTDALLAELEMGNK